MADWTPNGAGAAFELSRIMKPLEPFREDTLVLSGLAHRNGMALGDGPGDHARAAASYLTGVHPRKTAGADIQNGISVDQIAAQHIGAGDAVRLARARVRRFANGRQLRLRLLLRLHQQPRLARAGDADAAGDESAPGLRAAVRRHRYQPHTGGARAAHALSPQHPRSRRRADDGADGRPGPADKRKLDEYLSSIREIERRIERAEKDLTGLTPTIDKPTGIPVNYADYVNLMFDLQLIAFQTDMTRIVTMMMGREGSMRTYPEIGVPDPHHPLTHHRGNANGSRRSPRSTRCTWSCSRASSTS